MLASVPTSLAAFEPRVGAFVSECEAYVKWQWEGRFGVALATVDAADGMLIRDATMTCFEQEWSAESITRAPQPIRDFVGKLGGLRAGQSLYTTAQDGGVTLVCAWWPWDNGRRISLRVGAVGDGAAESTLRGWFGL